jgi:membrane complex biogenesis BtpA family protein
MLPEKSVIGMLHLAALPGSPANKLSLNAIEDIMLGDADALVDGGAHGLLLENFADAPFFPERVPALTVACMTRLACSVRRRFDVPLGINVLRNDGQSALAIALAVNAQFIRVNVLTSSRVTDQGTIHGIAHHLMRDRKNSGADAIQVWADVNVKHSVPLAERPVEDEVADTIHRGLADAVIASGSGTGQTTALGEIRRFRQAANSTPVYVGSGVNIENVSQVLEHADGVIIGSALKKSGDVSQPVDRSIVREFMQAFNDPSTRTNPGPPAAS